MVVRFFFLYAVWACPHPQTKAGLAHVLRARASSADWGSCAAEMRVRCEHQPREIQDLPGLVSTAPGENLNKLYLFEFLKPHTDPGARLGAHSPGRQYSQLTEYRDLHSGQLCRARRNKYEKRTWSFAGQVARTFAVKITAPQRRRGRR